MSEQDKGSIVERMASLPPIMQAMAEGFVQGLAAAKRNEPESETNPEREASRNSLAKEAKEDG